MIDEVVTIMSDVEKDRKDAEKKQQEIEVKTQAAVWKAHIKKVRRTYYRASLLLNFLSGMFCTLGVGALLMYDRDVLGLALLAVGLLSIYSSVWTRRKSRTYRG